MNKNHQILKNIQHRKILDMMSVPLWVNRQTQKSAIKIHSMSDGLENSRLCHLLSDKTQENTKSIASKNNKLNDDNSVKSNTQKSSDDSLMGIDIKNLIVKNGINSQDNKSIVHEAVLPDVANMPKVRFYLQGLRYGQWVFMVDALTMNEQEQALWQSLKNALMQEAQKNNTSNHKFLYREIHYPLVDDEFRSDIGLNPAQYTFDGFVIGLSASNDHIAKLVFLNSMPNQIVTPSSQALPSISEMVANPALKRDFWQKVVE